MKIAVILPYLSGFGGTETVIKQWNQNLSYYLNKEVDEVDYLFPQGCENYQWQGNMANIKNNNITIKSRAIRNITGIFWLCKYVFFKNYDIYVCSSSKVIKLLNMYNKIKKKMIIVSWIHFSLTHKDALNPKDVIKAKYHFSLCGDMTKELIELGVRKEDIYTIGNPIARTESTIYASNDDVVRFVYVGRLILNGQKNLESLINCLNRIESLNMNYKWRLDFYGDGSDKEKIMELVKKKKLDKMVTFHGWTSDPFEKIKQADYLILPSKKEGFGMVLVEAISRGLMCVSANCKVGPADIIKPNINGYLYNTEEEFYEIILSCFKNKRKVNYNEIKDSINQFYFENYFTKLSQSFKNIIER